MMIYISALKYFFCIYILTLSIALSAAVNVNSKWISGDDGLWTLSINPTGSYDVNPQYPSGLKCVPASGNTCVGGWSISISGGGVGSAGKACYPMASVSAGTTLGAALRIANSDTLGISCSLGRFNLNGNERICIYSSFDGLWNDGYNSYPGVNLFGSRYGCAGGIVSPVPPLSCSMNDIVIDHGTINFNDLSNSEKTVQGIVSCNRKATVQMSLSGNGRINFDGTGKFYSQIKINGNDGQNTIIVDPTSLVNFTSNIFYIGDDPISGDFKGGLSLVLDIK